MERVRLPRQRARDDPSKRKRKQHPRNPENDKSAYLDGERLGNWQVSSEIVKQGCKKRDGKAKKQEPKKGLSEKREESPGEGSPRLRVREVPTAAPGAGLSGPRVRVKFRTQLHVVAAATGIAKQRFSAGRMSARIAILHGSGWR